MTTDSVLSEFFGVYFHQDWVLDYETWERAVDTFALENPADVRATRDAITALLARCTDDAQVEEALRDAGCSYRDRFGRMSYHDWLGQVVARLQARDDAQTSARSAS